MKKIVQILAQKSKVVVKADEQSTVYEALTLMTEHNISSIIVTNNQQLTGIFTERDYARKVVLHGKSSRVTLLKEVMTPSPIVVNPNDSVDYCMEIMTEKHIRHLPVVETGDLIGLISIGDLVKFVIQDQKQTITDLESYIQS